MADKEEIEDRQPREEDKLRAISRAHVIAWRKDLEARELADTSIRRKLSALSSPFDYMCERNAVLGKSPIYEHLGSIRVSIPEATRRCPR